MKQCNVFLKQGSSGYIGFPLSLFVAALLLVLLSSFPVAAGDGQPDSYEPRPLKEFEVHFRESVFRGWRWFQTSFARDGVSCVNCHPNHDAIRLWYRAYPKVEVFDGTPYRVKGIREVVIEALEKHTDLNYQGRMNLVEDLVAYIAWWGEGQAIRPGYSRSLPPASIDLDRLRSSVQRGRKLVGAANLGPCDGCHARGEEKEGKGLSLESVAAIFPRYVDPPGKVMSLEAYLSWHLATRQVGKSPEGRLVTDIAAYLVSLAEGKTLQPGGDNDEKSD
jgi:hypothetical protein